MPMPDAAGPEAVEYFPSPTIGPDGNPVLTPVPSAAEPQGPVPAAAAPVDDPAIWPDGHPTRQNQSVPDAAPVKPAKEDPSRYEYWQAQFNREQQRAKQLEAQLAQRTPVEQSEAPRVLPQSNPDAGEAPKMPVRPTPPAKYDEVEALNDPASESFKYRKAVDQYRDDVLDYQLKKDAWREAREQQAAQQREQMAQAQQQLRQLHGQLVANYRMTPAEAMDFIQTMQDPASVSVENLVRLYRLQKQAHTSQAPDLQRRSANDAPLPAGMGGGESTAPLNEENAFNGALLRYSKRPQKG